MESQVSRSGFTLIEMLVVLVILGILTALLVPAIQQSRATSRDVQCINNLKQIGTALIAHAGSHRGRFPELMYSPDPARPHYWSWMALILPQLDRRDVFDRIDFSKSAFTAASANEHRDITSLHLAVLHCPDDQASNVAYEWDWGGSTGLVGYEHTNYLGCRGSTRALPGNGVFPDRGVKSRIDDIPDGTSQTIMLGERPIAVPPGVYGWWCAGSGRDVHGLADCVLDSSAGLHDGTLDDASRFHWWSYHRNKANFLMADGNVRPLSYDLDHRILLKLSSRNEGQPVTEDF